MDETAAPEPVHDLLLRLAGRVDDDLLGEARELVALGEDGRALELVTAALAAEAVELPGPVRSALAEAARLARIDLDADAALAPAGHRDDDHVFVADAGPAEAVLAALSDVPTRRLADCELRLTWRLTPAGVASGPLPQAVVLVRSSGGGPPEVIAYQLATAFARRGLRVAVEVLAAGKPAPRYHAAAWPDSVALLPAADAADAEPHDGGPAGTDDAWADGELDGRHRPVEEERRAVPADAAWTYGGDEDGYGPWGQAGAGRDADGGPTPADDRQGPQPEHPGADLFQPHPAQDGRRAPEHPGWEPAGSGPMPEGRPGAGAPGPGSPEGREPAPRPLPMRPPGGRRRLVEQPEDSHHSVTPLTRGPGPGPIDRRRPSPRPAPPSPVAERAEDGVPRPARPDPAELTDTPTFAAMVNQPRLDPPDSAGDSGSGQRSSTPGRPGPAAPRPPGPVRGPGPAGSGPSAGARPPSGHPGVPPTVQAPAAAPDEEHAWAGEWSSGNWAIGGPNSPPAPDPAGPPTSGLLHPETVTRLSAADRELLARLQAELVAGRRPTHRSDGGTNGSHTDPEGR